VFLLNIVNKYWFTNFLKLKTRFTNLKHTFLCNESVIQSKALLDKRKIIYKKAGMVTGG